MALASFIRLVVVRFLLLTVPRVASTFKLRSNSAIRNTQVIAGFCKPSYYRALRVEPMLALPDWSMLVMIVRITFVALVLMASCHYETHSQPSGWSTPVNISNTPGNSYYPALAADRSGKLFVVWEERDQPDNDLKARIYVATHDLNGWSWPAPITELGKMDWTPDVAVDTCGHPHVVWAEYLSGEVYYKHNNGISWSSPTNVSQTPGGGSFYPRILIDRSNKIHVIWHDNALGDNSVYYRTFDGSVWSPITILSDSLRYSGFARIAVAAREDLHVTWESRMPPGDNREVFYRSRVGGTWTSIRRLTFDTLYSIAPVVAVRHNNWPIVVWQQTVDISQYPIVQRIYWSISDSMQWTQPMWISERSQSRNPSVVVDHQGVVHVVWELYTRIGQSGVDSVLYANFQGSTWTAPLNVSQSCPYQHCGNPVICVDSTQRLHVLWIAVNEGLQARAEIYYTSYSSTSSAEKDETIQDRARVSLCQNYPNPFNSHTFIRYAVGRSGRVMLAVFDMLGREILRVPRIEEAGEHVWVFDGSVLASGIYQYSIRSEGHVLNRRMLLIR